MSNDLTAYREVTNDRTATPTREGYYWYVFPEGSVDFLYRDNDGCFYALNFAQQAHDVPTVDTGGKWFRASPPIPFPDGSIEECVVEQVGFARQLLIDASGKLFTNLEDLENYTKDMISLWQYLASFDAKLVISAVSLLRGEAVKLEELAPVAQQQVAILADALSSITHLNTVPTTENDETLQ